MAIKSGNTVEVLITSSDTTIINPTTGRIVISSGLLTEQTGNAETLELFISTDASSAAGERLEKLVFAADEPLDPISLPDRGIPSGSFLIGKATTGNRVKAYITYTQFTGSS